MTLRRELGLLHATMMGLGSTISAGIFVILGQAAGIAGPAVILSFLFCPSLSCPSLSFSFLSHMLKKRSKVFLAFSPAGMNGLVIFSLQH